jgi:hypothetical protein
MLHNTSVSVSHTKIFGQEFDWYDPQDILILVTSEVAITLLMSTAAPLSQKTGVLWLGMTRVRIIWYLSNLRKSEMVKMLTAAFSISCILKGALFCVNNLVYIHALHFTLVIEDFDTTIDMFVP